MSRSRFIILLLLIALGFLGAFLSGFFLDSYFDPQVNHFPILNQAYNILVNHAYIDLPAPAALEYGMIRGLLQSSNDPYASFQEPVQHELETNNLQGSFGGIGAEFSHGLEGEILIFPIGNGPAAKVGIRKGDQLLAVDQLVISPETRLDEVKAAERGPVGEPVHLVVSRPETGSSHEFDIQREIIHLPSVTWRAAPDQPEIGILKVHIIAESTADEIEKAVGEMQNEGAGKFILDLRDNGGGLLTAGVDIARLFLRDGVIIQQQYRGQDEETYQVNRPGRLKDLPLVILINNNTASAAEIVAGALQSQGRTILIGENSFGKDSIQLIFDLDDGSSLHITSAKWWIPDLTPPIGEGGLLPEIQVEQEDDQLDLSLQTAVQYLRNE